MGTRFYYILLLFILCNTLTVQQNLLNIMMPFGILNQVGSYVQYYRLDPINGWGCNVVFERVIWIVEVYVRHNKRKTHHHLLVAMI